MKRMSDMTPTDAPTFQKILDGASVHPSWTHERQKAPGETLRDCLLNPAPLGKHPRHCWGDAVRGGEDAPPRSWKHEAMPTAPPEINFQPNLAMRLAASQIDRGFPVLSAKLSHVALQKTLVKGAQPVSSMFSFAVCSK